MSERSPSGTTTEPAWGTLHERLDVAFRLGRDQRELQFEGSWWTWRELGRIWCEIRELAPADVLTGTDASGVVARNHPAVCATILGALRARRTYVSLNPMYPDDALAEDIAAIRPRCLLGVRSDVGRPAVQRVAEELGIQLLELPDTADGHVREIVPAGTGSGWFPAALDVAVSMLTSGTTGKAKRIKIPPDHLRATVVEAQEHSGMDVGPLVKLGRRVSVHQVPMAHISALFGLLMSVTQGRRAALLERFEPHAWAELVQEHQVVVGNLPPAAMRSLLDADVPAEKLASLRYLGTGTAPLRLADADEFHRRYGIPVLQSYGATEFAGGISSFTAIDHRKWGDAKRGSVGRPHPGIDLKIVDPESGAELPDGAKGRLLARTSHSATGDATVWIETNDLATIDEDGFLYIHGRLDDVIIRGGFKIDPAEVRAVLLGHAAVRDAAVIGAPDERLGQVPVAGIELASGAETTEQELREWVRAQLSPYKVPVRIRVLDALPRNVSMKVTAPDLLAAVLAG